MPNTYRSELLDRYFAGDTRNRLLCDSQEEEAKRVDLAYCSSSSSSSRRLALAAWMTTCTMSSAITSGRS